MSGFTPAKAIISECEIGVDVENFPTAMTYVVRLDPDVLFNGEMRDRETLLSGIQAAETGHLVFATLHTANAMQVFGWILEFFPFEEREFIRNSFSKSLLAVCAQWLLPAVSSFDAPEAPVTEVLRATPPVREFIRQNRDSDLPTIIRSSQSDGLRSFAESLAELVEMDAVDMKTAMEYAPNRKRYEAS